MKAILHFGMHKTGSSSIQSSFHQNLIDENFYYVSLASSNSSLPMATIFRDEPQQYHTHKKRGKSKSEVEALKKVYQDRLEQALLIAKDRTTIISAEDVDTFSKEELSKVRFFLNSRDRQVTAVGYIRKPIEFMESAFQQRLKSQGCELNLAKLCPRYRVRFKPFDQTFGRDNVLFWPFEPSNFLGHDVVLDFADKIGMKYSPDLTVRVNEALSLPAIKLLYCYRKFGPNYGVGTRIVRENSHLVKTLAEIKGPKLRFHSDITLPVLKSRAGDIKWMEDRLGASLHEDASKHDDIAIRTESDLLTIDESSTHWLAMQLGPDYVSRWHDKLTPQDVADWMHVLRLKLANNTAAGATRQPLMVPPAQLTNLPSVAASAANNPTDNTTNIPELIRRNQATGTDKTSKIPPLQAQQLITEAFDCIKNELKYVSHNHLTIGGLGKFRNPINATKKMDGSIAEQKLLFEPVKSPEKIIPHQYPKPMNT